MDTVELAHLRRVVPELFEELLERVHILQRVRLLQPIGRRALATETGQTERVLRAHVDVLREQGILLFTASGMSLSEEGTSLLERLDGAIATLEGRDALATSLSRTLGIDEVIVVAGDSDHDEFVKQALGFQAADTLIHRLNVQDVLAVTGGTTMAAIAAAMPKPSSPLPVQVVPARGGLGENVAVQSNTIASDFARKLGGTSIMLHVPDQLSQDTLQRLVTEPQIQERLLQVRQASFVIHGIGDALSMAKRRHLPDADLHALRERGAVAEAFGYYFDDAGQTVHTMTTVGLRLDDLERIRVVMGVAGGRSKAAAILAAAKAYKMNVLVTDEGAAKSIVQQTGGV
jgi:central glycolytic genes regulator